MLSKHHFLFLLFGFGSFEWSYFGLLDYDYFWFFGRLLLDLIIIQDINDFLSYFFFSNFGYCFPYPFYLYIASFFLKAFESITHIIQQILLLIVLDITVLLYFCDERDYIIGEMLRELLAGYVNLLDNEGNYVEIMWVKIPKGVFVLCYPSE